MKLESNEHVIEYVNGELTEKINQLLANRQSIFPFGVVIANGDTCMLNPGSSKAIAARGLLQAVRRTNAEGAMFVHQENNQITVQLEHKKLGDLVWKGPIISREVILGPPSGAVEKTRFMPNRYLN